jgi:hypothetical protein
LKIPTSIPEIIKWTVKEYGGNAKAINDGYCEEFTTDIIERMGGETKNLYELRDGYFSDSGDLPGHVWIYYNGKHYDSETPNGIKSWKSLPVFKRLMRVNKYKRILSKLPEKPNW